MAFSVVYHCMISWAITEVSAWLLKGWSADANMLTGYGSGYQYGAVATTSPQAPQQQTSTGDELVAELMQATQGVRISFHRNEVSVQ